jgi:hypothetical protein
MATVNVLTLKTAADRLATYRERVKVMLAAGKLTPATINGKEAVVDDLAFRRAVRKVQKVAA